MKSIKRRLRGLVGRASGLLSLIETEAQSSTRMPLRRKVSWWRKGFFSYASLIYDRDHVSAGLYLSDYARYILTSRINLYNEIVGNKLACHLMLRHFFGDCVPITYAVKQGSSLVGVDINDSDPMTYITRQIQDGRQVFVKPVVGSKGKGAFCIGKTEEFREWAAQDCDGYMICESLEQHPYSREIYGSALNTIRIVTATDGDGPFVVASAHRFGTNASRPVDNWSAGGISVGIDAETGVMTKGAPHPRHSGDRLVWHERHPDTRAQIHGVMIPEWPRLRKAILAMAWRLSFLPYLGWDVALTPSGLKVIELNGNSDVHVLQIHAPLLQDERTRIFFERHRVLATKDVS